MSVKHICDVKIYWDYDSAGSWQTTLFIKLKGSIFLCLLLLLLCGCKMDTRQLVIIKHARQNVCKVFKLVYMWKKLHCQFAEGKIELLVNDVRFKSQIFF